MSSFLTIFISAFSGLTVGSACTWIFRSKLEKGWTIWKHLDSVADVRGLKMVIVTRSDLELSRGKLAAQCAHAATTSYMTTLKHSPYLAHAWEGIGQPKIVVRCKDEIELQKLANKAKELNVISVIIRDAGKTEIASGTVTALGLGPASTKYLDAISGHLKLV